LNDQIHENGFANGYFILYRILYLFDTEDVEDFFYAPGFEKNIIWPIQLKNSILLKKFRIIKLKSFRPFINID